MSEPFTRVEIAFYPDYLNWWLRFGTSDEQHDLDRRRSFGAQLRASRRLPEVISPSSPSR